MTYSLRMAGARSADAIAASAPLAEHLLDLLNRGELSACPDCPADLALHVRGSVAVVTVEHEPTCPARAATRRNTAR